MEKYERKWAKLEEMLNLKAFKVLGNFWNVVYNNILQGLDKA